MSGPHTVITEAIYNRFVGVLDELGRQSNAKFVFLLDRAGQQIAASGDLTGVDPTALASLTAGNVAATEGVAQIVGEPGFSSLYHEGKQESLHITVVAGKVILLVVFDEHSSLGLVRLRVDQHLPQLSEVVTDFASGPKQSQSAPASEAEAGGFPEISDEDIDALFG